ncbi:hypothetical protein ACWT_5967 [Actinoplanes sp. SE50]|nr:hypothetical protein ACPL_6099 [Actinoplanes sp. SE50/110]ATO85382.1 hypothetical protein ACWT_5967 [Actinoplanes sp. SE50]SLM02794.1 hypothetical protein ACSP50_6079 [Actinoplanes sp. SE50/110]
MAGQLVGVRNAQHLPAFPGREGAQCDPVAQVTLQPAQQPLLQALRGQQQVDAEVAAHPDDPQEQVGDIRPVQEEAVELVDEDEQRGERGEGRAAGPGGRILPAGGERPRRPQQPPSPVELADEGGLHPFRRAPVLGELHVADDAGRVRQPVQLPEGRTTPVLDGREGELVRRVGHGEGGDDRTQQFALAGARRTDQQAVRVLAEVELHDRGVRRPPDRDPQPARLPPRPRPGRVREPHQVREGLVRLPRLSRRLISGQERGQPRRVDLVHPVRDRHRALVLPADHRHGARRDGQVDPVPRQSPVDVEDRAGPLHRRRLHPVQHQHPVRRRTVGIGVRQLRHPRPVNLPRRRGDHRDAELVRRVQYRQLRQHRPDQRGGVVPITVQHHPREIRQPQPHRQLRHRGGAQRPVRPVRAHRGGPDPDLGEVVVGDPPLPHPRRGRHRPERPGFRMSPELGGSPPRDIPQLLTATGRHRAVGRSRPRIAHRPPEDLTLAGHGAIVGRHRFPTARQPDSPTAGARPPPAPDDGNA